MNQREILQKQNQRNTLSKKSKEKILAALLAGSITAFTISPQIASASTTETQTASAETNEASEKAVERRTITYNLAHPSDIVLNNIDLKDKSVSNLAISYNTPIQSYNLVLTDTSVTIPLKEVSKLKLVEGKTYNTSINFYDSPSISGAIYIEVINDSSIPPSDNTPDINEPTDTPEGGDGNTETKPNQPSDESSDSSANPPADDSDNSDNESKDDVTDDDNTEVPETPETNKVTKEFDYEKPENIVITNDELKDIDLTDLQVTKFLINGVEVDLSYLECTNDDITISQEAFKRLALHNGNNTTEIHFSNNSILSNVLDIEIKNSTDKPTDEETNKPSEDSKPSETIPDKESEAPIIPVINKEDFIFNRDNASDIVLKDVDLKGLDITEVYIYATKIDPKKLKIEDNSITIPKEVIWDLSFKNGTYYLAFHFSNGSIISGYTSITITDNENANTVKPPNNNNTGAITPPPISNTTNGNTNTTKPPVKDEVINKPDVPTIIKPEFPKQTITFNRDNGTDVVISNVNFKGLKLKDFYIYGRRIPVSKLKTTKDSIIIPKEVIWDLYLKNGTYPMSAIFENDTYVSGVAFLKMTDGGSIYPESNDTVIKYPEMIRQGFEFDWANPRGINITYVNFNGNKLKSIKLNNRILNSDSFTTTDNSIHISAEVLESLKLSIGVYDLSFTFSNGVTLTGYSDLTVVHSKDIIRNEDPIILDTSKEDAIEIPNLIPEGTMVDSITINNVVLDVIYRDSRISKVSLFSLKEGNPVVYVETGKIIIPTETLAYIGNNSGNYEVSVRLDNGSTIIQDLAIKSELDNYTIKTDNIVNANQNTIFDYLSSSTIKNNSSTNISSEVSETPKTGDAAATGLLSTLVASIAGLAVFRRKK